MDNRSFPRHRRGPVRQAHPRHARHRGADWAALLAGVLLLGVVTIGTVIGAGATGPVAQQEAPSWSSFAMPPAASADASGQDALDAAIATTGNAATATPRVGATDPVAIPGGPAASPRTLPSPRGAGPGASHAAPAIVDQATALPSWIVPRPVAAFLGDSYTTGWAGAGTGGRGWPAIVGAANGWRVVNRAVAGTGFVNPGWTGQPVRTRVASVARANPGIVFVAAGHNDARYGSRATGEAADAVLRRLRRALPDAVIVVIGPIWANGSPPASIRGIRAELRASAAAVDAVFVDPLRDGWFAGAAERLIQADGIHPSDAGHRRIARLVLAALEDVR